MNYLTPAMVCVGCRLCRSLHILHPAPAHLCASSQPRAALQRASADRGGMSRRASRLASGGSTGAVHSHRSPANGKVCRCPETFLLVESSDDRANKHCSKIIDAYASHAMIAIIFPVIAIIPRLYRLLKVM